MESIKGKKTNIINRVILYILIVIILAGFMFPLYWLFGTGFKARSEIMLFPPHYIAEEPTVAAFKESFEKDLFPGIYNSTIVAVVSTFIAIFLGTLAAYAFERFKFRGRDNLAFWILSMRMLPPIAIAIPFFLLMQKLQLLDTVIALILMHTMFNLPIAVWLMRSFIRDVPTDVEQASLVDGYSRMRSFLKITLPLIRPGIVVTSIFCFIFSWNEFLFALILTRQKAVTMPVALWGLQGVWGTEWHRIGAISLIIFIPVLIGYIFIQKYLVRGLTFGAIKG